MYRFGGVEGRLYAELLDQAEAASRLATDLTRLASGQPLCEKAIEAAPLFERYLFVNQPTIVCIGYSSNGMGADSTFTHTGEVMLDAAQEGWIRTRDKLCRVGQRLNHPIPLVGDSVGPTFGPIRWQPALLRQMSPQPEEKNV